MAEIVRALAGIDAEWHPTMPLTDCDGFHRRPTSPTLWRWRSASESRPKTARRTAGAKDIAYAFRRLIESVAATTPLVLIFEDIHWAEPPLLDLIEYLATWTREAPVLIVCPSRPELLDTRPAWGSGRMEASRISLEPLTEEESRSLLGALLTVEDLPAELRQRVLDRAEGNPLYVEEVVRLLIEEGVVEQRNGHWYATQAAANVRVPDSVEALIRARLDTLPAPERVLLQAGAVVGRVFQRSAVASIAPPDQVPPPLETHLEDAILRDIITEERAPDEPTFRFRHILIRDVAYNTLPKARRAELHAGVARWLRDWAGPRIDELIEIEAYHLEQAVKLRREVGEPVAAADVDAGAAALLASADKAQRRDDYRAQRTFALRGLELDPANADTRLELRLLAAEAVGHLGEYSRSGTLVESLAEDAAAAGRPDIEGRALFTKAISSWINPESANAAAALADLRLARVLLTEAEDWDYLAQAVEYLGYEGWWYGDMGLAAERWREMAQIAHDHGLIDRETQAIIHLSQIESLLGRPDRRRQRLEEARALAEHGANRLTRARLLRQLGMVVSVNDSEEEGRRFLREAAAALDELGDTEELASAIQFEGDSWYRVGELAKAMELYRRVAPLLAEHMGYLPEVERRMAHALLDMGDIGEAETMALQAVAHTVDDDWATVASSGKTLGLVRAAQGRNDEAEKLLRDAIATIADREFPADEEYLALAGFLYRTGRPAEGAEWLAKFRVTLGAFAPEAPWRKWAEAQARAAEAPTG